MLKYCILIYLMQCQSPHSNCCCKAPWPYLCVTMKYILFGTAHWVLCLSATIFIHAVLCLMRACDGLKIWVAINIVRKLLLSSEVLCLAWLNSHIQGLCHSYGHGDFIQSDSVTAAWHLKMPLLEWKTTLTLIVYSFVKNLNCLFFLFRI